MYNVFQAEALGMDPKEKGKKQSPADLAKVQKVKAQIARNKSALNVSLCVCMCV